MTGLLLLLLVAACSTPPAEPPAAPPDTKITLNLPPEVANAPPPPDRYAAPPAPSQPDLLAIHQKVTGEAAGIAEGQALAEDWLRGHPDDAEALFLVGHSLIRQRRFAEAQAPLERAVALAPEHHPARKDYAGALLSEGRCDLGTPHLDHLLNAGITYGGEMYYMRSFCRKLANDLHGAKADADAACALAFPKSCRISKWLDGRIAAAAAAAAPEAETEAEGVTAGGRP